MSMETTGIAETGGTDGPNYVIVGLAVGIPCGAVILLLVILIVIMLSITTCKTGNQEELEMIYARRRFQGLSLEQQRKLQNAKKGRFKRRRSNATTASRPSTVPSSIQLDPHSTRSRVRKQNPFQLQEWQLKMSGIDVSRDPDDDDTDTDSPRTPIGAVNPLLIQDDLDEPDYEPVKPTPKKVNIVEQSPERQQAAIRPAPDVTDESNSDSSDSFNPYD